MERITVNMVPGGPLEICHASQFDVGREIAFDLIAGKAAFTLDGTETVNLKIARPDGTTIVEAVPNTSDSYVIWTSAEGDCDIAGVSECEISVTKGDDLLGSGNFMMQVEKDVYDGTHIRTLSVGPADICTFSPTIAEPLVSVKTTLTPSLTGYTTVNVTRCGVNLWGHTDVTTVSATYVINNEDVYMPAGTYTFQFKFSGTTGNKSCRIDDVDGNQIATFGAGVSVGLNSDSFTIPEGKVGVKFKFYSAAIGTFSDMMFSIGSSVPDFKAYTGNAYAISLGDTYYGGVLDVTRGKLSVTWGKTKLNELTGWQYRSEQFDVYIYGGFPCNTAGIPSYFICDSYPVKNTGHSGSYTGETCAWQGISATDALMLRIRDANYSDITSFLNAMGNAEVAYKLATPFDIDLTPVQIAAIVGQNNVFSDCGQTEVKYLTIE